MTLKEMALLDWPEFGGLSDLVPGLICFGFLAVPVATVIITVLLATAQH